LRKYNNKNTTRAVTTAVIINVIKKVIAIAPPWFKPPLPSLWDEVSQLISPSGIKE
jgi:hypothetical protein